MEKITILKKAIILEQQGQAFYNSIQEKTELESLKIIFNTMAKEEKTHEKYLRNQLEQLTGGGTLNETATGEISSEFADAVLLKKITDAISGSSYEAAAISAAMELEIKTVQYYEELAQKADSDEENKFFHMLSEWESSHLKVLSKMNRDILEQALQEDIY